LSSPGKEQYHIIFYVEPLYYRICIALSYWSTYAIVSKLCVEVLIDAGVHADGPMNTLALQQESVY